MKGSDSFSYHARCKLHFLLAFVGISNAVSGGFQRKKS